MLSFYTEVYMVYITYLFILLIPPLFQMDLGWLTPDYKNNNNSLRFTRPNI